MADKPLKAFSVLEDDENTGDIYFARHAITARRTYADEHHDGELSGTTCHRAPWADQYAPGPVPWKAKFEHGWWIECSGCGAMIRQDEEDSEGKPIEFDVVETGSHVFCRPACETEHRAEQARLTALRAEAISDLTAAILQKMPGAEIETEAKNWTPHAYVTKRNGEYQRQQCVVSFRFPGCQHGLGSMRYDKVGEEPRVTVPSGDLPAFEAWRDAGYPAATVNP
jgi:hypothetical protein